MRKDTQDSPNTSRRPAIDRRGLLRGVAAAGTAATGSVVALMPARAEIWEEGDIQCRPLVQETAPAYDIDDALLMDFMKLSETLTGVKPLDRRFGVQYLQRYARNPDLSALLPQLIKAYREWGAYNRDEGGSHKKYQEENRGRGDGWPRRRAIDLFVVRLGIFPASRPRCREQELAVRLA